MRAHFPLVPHGLDLSLGSAEGLDDAYVDKFARLIERIDPPWWSEHLCFTRAGGIAIGHLAALPQSRAALDAVARNVDMLRKKIKAPLILENVTTVVAVPGAEMDEAEFLTRALERTGCGWLCDVANLHANAVNHGADVEAGFDRWPWQRVVQIHFAGGRWRGEVLIDSHDSATSEAVWALFARVAAVAPIKGAILERDEKIPSFGELLGELERARLLLAARHDQGPHPEKPRSGVSKGARRIGAAESFTSAPRVWPSLETAPSKPPRDEVGGNGRDVDGVPAGEPQDLAATQNLLARLFTDAGFRDAFFASDGETFAALDRRSLSLFADSLISKRLADARKTLPWTAKALGRDFAALLRPLLAGPAPAGRHRADARRLLARLEEKPAPAPQWIADLARYEQACVEAATPGFVCKLQRFRWPPARLALAARQGSDPGPRKTSFALWFRPPNGALRHFLI